MASIPYETIASSGVFNFVVGPDKRTFSVHSALVASQSPSLKVLVEGHMKEASEQRVEWDETDEATFVRFCQFAYTGNYDGHDQPTTIPRVALPSVTIPHAIIPEPEPEETTEAAELEDDPWGIRRVSIRTAKERRAYAAGKEAGKEAGKSLAAEHRSGAFSAATPTQFKEQCPTALCRHDTVSWSDGTEALLAHARMYTFADYHGIAALQTLALCKLHRILVQFTLGHESIGAIADLAGYAYGHTRADQNDRLRSMISMYVACNILAFRGSQDFLSLVRTVGDFAEDLFKKI